MATGVLLCQGARAECDGRIRAGSVPAFAFNKPIAKEDNPMTCGKDGKTDKIIGEQISVRRDQLLKALVLVLSVAFLNKAMKFGEYTKIKNALGLSSSSVTHKWNETGISEIEGYAIP